MSAIIDRDTGELLWFPTEEAQANFTVEVSDGRGGKTRQEFAVDLYEELGSIRGGVFEDLNGNGFRDTTLLQGEDPAIIFVIDVSGSTGGRGVDWTKTDLDEVDSLSIIDMELASILELREQLILHRLQRTYLLDSQHRTIWHPYYLRRSQ